MTKHSIQYNSLQSGPTPASGSTLISRGTDINIPRSGVKVCFHTTAYSNDRDTRRNYHARAQGSKRVEVLDTSNLGFSSPATLESRVATRRSWLSSLQTPEVGFCLSISNLESAVTSHLSNWCLSAPPLLYRGIQVLTDHH